MELFNKSIQKVLETDASLSGEYFEFFMAIIADEESKKAVIAILQENCRATCVGMKAVPSLCIL